MKTRKKIKKIPGKGRRSSIICVKRSPISNQNLYCDSRNVHRDFNLLDYESPLNHLYKISPSKSPELTTLVNNDDLRINIENIHRTNQESDSIKNLSLTLNNIIELGEKQEENKNENENTNQEEIMKTISTQSIPSSKCSTSSSISTSLEKLPYSKRKKLNSPLSRISNANEDTKYFDSIICLDDTELQPISKPIFQNSEINDALIKPTESSTTVEQLTSNEEVVVIDCNDSLLDNSEFESNVCDETINLSNSSSKFRESVIVIEDPDDEFPNVSAQTTNTLPKFNEDCFVVWSSLPETCTSNNKLITKTNTPNEHSSINKNLKTSKSNKIILDRQADFTNLKYLNNENDKPLKKKPTKSPKVRKSVKKSLKNIANTKAKRGAKSKNEGSPKIAMKSFKKVAKNTSMKASTKINAATALKNRIKNNGELIFLSESKEDIKTLSKTSKSKKGKLREIVIDGSNVAMAYTKNKTFSEKGIKMLIDYFMKKGHTVKVFVPQYRRALKFPLLEKWHTEGIVVFTPSRKLGNKSFTPYDDRYIIEYATACNGIVVSQDQFRDLYAEKPQYRDTIENRLLVPTFVGEYVMFPEDPLGRGGPTLADFLKH